MIVQPGDEFHKDSVYDYDEFAVSALIRAISEERFATYLNLADGNPARALQIYTRNIALGAAFHGPLQTFEVTLRNAVHEVMTASYGVGWIDKAPLQHAEHSRLDESVRLLTSEGRSPTPGRVIAASSFGFWIALFAKKYDATLWRAALHRVFGKNMSRSDAHQQLDRLRTLRNRIAHHEPIMQRRLSDDHERILSLLRALSVPTAAWVAHHSRVPEVLAESSRRITRF